MNDISNADLAETMNIAVTISSKTNWFNVWDYEKGTLIERIQLASYFKTEFSLIKILDPYPLVVITDIQGYAFIYGWKEKP